MKKIDEFNKRLEEINHQIQQENESFAPIQEEFLTIKKEYDIKENKHLDLIKQLTQEKEKIENEKNIILYNTYNYKDETYQYLGKSKIENTLYTMPNIGYLCEINSQICLLVPMKYTISYDDRRHSISGYGKQFICEDIKWNGYETGYRFGTYDLFSDYRFYSYDDDNPRYDVSKIGYGLLGIKLNQDSGIVCAKWNWNYDYYVAGDGPYTKYDYLKIAFDLDKMDIEVIDDYKTFMNLENAPIKF